MTMALAKMTRAFAKMTRALVNVPNYEQNVLVPHAYIVESHCVGYVCLSSLVMCCFMMIMTMVMNGDDLCGDDKSV